jgi:hypothetical protein
MRTADITRAYASALGGRVWGISLIDGSQPRGCDLRMCGVRILGVDEAWQIKLNGPADPKVRAEFKAERRWWR